MVTVKPAGLSSTAQTANQVSLTVSYSERYRKPSRCKSSTPLQVSVTYSVGETKYSGTSLIVPIIAVVTAVHTLYDGSTTMKTFAETFDIAFQGEEVTTNTATVASLGKVSNSTTISCGFVTLAVTDSITITVS